VPYPTVCKTLTQVITDLRNEHGDTCEIIFTKGGDRFANEIPERVVCEEFGVRIVDGLGLKTHNSSSYVARVANKADTDKLTVELASIPQEHKENEYIEVGYRPWGVYYVLEDQPNFKIKKLIVAPKKRLSLQSHDKRSEHWVVVNGTATVQIREKDHPEHIGHRLINTNESCHVPQGHVHRLANDHDEHLVVIEVQCGDYTGEDDITRYHDDFGRDTH
jgi:mannose-6-phosphate isomerase-like protein (cupin superfamily)